MTLFGEIEGFCSEHAGDEAMKPYVEPLRKGLGDLQAATMWFMQNAMAKPDNAGAGATEYMHLMGRVALGYMWARIAKAAQERKAEGDGVAARMDAKLVTGRFFMERMMPETGALLRQIRAGSDAIMALPAEMF